MDQKAKLRLFKKLLQDQNLDYLEMPNGVRQRITKNHRFIWNYSNKSQSIDEIILAPTDVKIIAI